MMPENGQVVKKISMLNFTLFTNKIYICVKWKFPGEGRLIEILSRTEMF